MRPVLPPQAVTTASQQHCGLRSQVRSPSHLRLVLARLNVCDCVAQVQHGARNTTDWSGERRERVLSNGEGTFLLGSVVWVNRELIACPEPCPTQRDPCKSGRCPRPHHPLLCRIQA